MSFENKQTNSTREVMGQKVNSSVIIDVYVQKNYKFLHTR